MYVCMYACVRACMHACMYVYVCIYIYIYKVPPPRQRPEGRSVGGGAPTPRYTVGGTYYATIIEILFGDARGIQY